MKISFIGLGIMGLPMATNISKKYDVIGFDIIKKDTPFPFSVSYEECVKDSDILISMVPNNDNFKNLVNNVKNYLKKGTIWIDMSTISPSVNLEMKELLKEYDVELCDAPVVKSAPAAIKGELGIYFGGEKDIFDKVYDILLCMGKNIIYMGPSSSGLKMKILHNALVGEIQNGVNEIISMADGLGIDLNDFIKALGYGGAQCFYLDTKGKNIINREYPTAFSVENMNKDVHFAKEIADELNLEVPSLRNVVNVYEKAMDMGFNKKDFSSSYEVVKKNEVK